MKKALSGQCSYIYLTLQSFLRLRRTSSFASLTKPATQGIGLQSSVSRRGTAARRHHPACMERPLSGVRPKGLQPFPSS